MTANKPGFVVALIGETANKPFFMALIPMDAIKPWGFIGCGGMRAKFSLWPYLA